MSERDEEQTPGIVLTDAPESPRTGKHQNCPQCGAPKKERTASNGFGRTFKELCGSCGYVFGEKRRG